MTPERYQLIKSVFFEASAAKGEAREAVLQRHCHDDAVLRREVENLLGSHALDTSAVNVPFQPDAAAAVEKAIDQLKREAPTSAASAVRPEPHGEGDTPPHIAGYDIQRVIGRGGMGTVYAATQQKPRRTVALKIIRPGVASRAAMRRFEYEAQVLAHLRHPGIAQIFEAGTFIQDGAQRPYFVMEYIPEALTLAEYAKRKSLGTRERLQVFCDVCEAVHHGHQKGVIHRDIKPSNILVDAQGAIKVIDFGVARSTDADIAVTSMRTDVGQLIGTLQYMSPEQVSADPNDIDTRSDVYALGVVLYELLCGNLPYDLRGSAIHEATRIIRESNPVRLSSIDRKLKGDIETVALKALEKDRNRRYQSANDLRQDIDRYLRGQAISARPPSLGYQLHTLARRHKALSSSLAGLFLVLVSSIVIVSTLYVRTEAARVSEAKQRQEAQRQAATVQAVNQFLNDDLLAAANPNNTANPDITVREALDKAADRIKGRFPDEPLVEASICWTLGNSYFQLGEYKKAEAHMGRSLARREPELGQDHLDTLDAKRYIGLCKSKLGEYEEAGRLLEHVVDTGRRVYGPDNKHTMMAMDNLAGLAMRIGQNERAETLYREALDRQTRMLGREHFNTLSTMNNLTVLYGQLKRNEESAHLCAEAMEIARRTLGIEHPLSHTILLNLAASYTELEEYDKALPLSEEVLELSQRVLGAEHPDTLYAMNSLSRIYDRVERYAESEEMYKKTLEVRRRVLGDNHSTTSTSYHNLASLYRKMKRTDEAEALAREAVRIALAVHGEKFTKTLTYRNNLAKILLDQGRNDEGRLMQQDVVQHARELFGDDARQMAPYIADYALTLSGLQDPRAQSALEEAFTVLDQAGAPQRKRRDAVAAALAELSERNGEIARADEWRAKRSVEGQP